MSIEVKVPRLPESVADATLVTWHKAVGDSVERDENLADLETDKVVLEVPAPERGVLRELRVKNGATVTSGQLLAVLEPSVEGTVTPSAAEASPVVPLATVATPVATVAGRSAGKTGPAARRALEEKGVDPATIRGSGRDGRILKSDVAQAEPAQAGASGAAAGPSVAAPLSVPGGRAERRVAMSRLRARIAERMVAAQQNAAMLTTFNEVDLSAVMALRSRYKDTFEKLHGVRLGFMGFFVKAAIEALRRYPVVNASVEGNEIVYHDYYDIGIAVSTDRGLIVPVLRDADRLSFPGIESAIGEFGRKAREGALGMEDLTGGTFTITNGGVFGSLSRPRF